jgi:hypothetical protein
MTAPIQGHCIERNGKEMQQLLTEDNRYLSNGFT